jgi:hypothetical protein
MSARVLALCIALLLLTSATAHGQTAITLLPGGRVRVLMRDSQPAGPIPVKLGGIFQGMHGDTLLIRESFGSDSRVPRRSIVKIEIARERAHRWVHDPLVGAAAGFVIGTLATATNGDPNGPNYAPRHALIGVAIGGAVAAVGRRYWVKLGSSVL